jgi:hypothetical protein
MSTPWPGGPGPHRTAAPFARPYAAPFGGPFPAGLDALELPRVPRPPILVLALVLQLVSGLPFVLVGAVVLDGGAGLAAADAQLVGWVVLAAGLVFCTLSVVAFVGLNWARMLLGVLTGPVAVVLLVTLVNGAISMPGGRVVVSLILIAAVSAAVLMFLPGCAQFFANPRGRPAPPAAAGRL